MVILVLPLLVVLTFLMPMAYFLTSGEADLGSPGALMYTPESVALLAAETGIPVEALSAYLSAAGAFGEVGWTLLAGIGKEECDHGRSELPGCPYGTVNFCGARGPMQFLGNTWRDGTDPVPSGECPGQPGQSGERWFTGDPVGAPVAEGQEGQARVDDPQARQARGDQHLAAPALGHRQGEDGRQDQCTGERGQHGEGGRAA